MVAGRILQHAADRQRTLEQLLGLVVVVTVVVDAADVLLHAGLPQHRPQRDAFPEAHPQRVRAVVAGHHLEEPHAVFAAQFQQLGEGQRRTVGSTERVIEFGVALRIREYLQFPGLADQADLAKFVFGMRVGKRIAALDRAEFLTACKVLEFGDGRRQGVVRCRGLRRSSTKRQRPQARHAQAQKVTTRKFDVRPGPQLELSITGLRRGGT